MEKYPETMWDLDRLGAKRMTKDGWIELSGKRWVFRRGQHGWGAPRDLVALHPGALRGDVFAYAIRKEEGAFVLSRQINSGPVGDIDGCALLSEAKRHVTRHFCWHENSLVGPWYDLCIARYQKKHGKTATELLAEHDRVVERFRDKETGNVQIPAKLNMKATKINIECGFRTVSDETGWCRPGLAFAALEMPHMFGPVAVE